MTLNASERFALLIVEDHADTRSVLKRCLESRGYLVRCAGSLKEATELCIEESPEMIVSDIGLPDGTGWELLKKLRATRFLCAIAMSANDSLSDIEASRAAGFDAHIAKPFILEDLIALLEKFSRPPEIM